MLCATRDGFAFNAAPALLGAHLLGSAVTACAAAARTVPPDTPGEEAAMTLTHATLTRLHAAGFPLGPLVDGPLQASTHPSRSGRTSRDITIHTSTCHPHVTTAWDLRTEPPTESRLHLCRTEIYLTAEHDALRTALDIAERAGLGVVDTWVHLQLATDHLRTSSAHRSPDPDRLVSAPWYARQHLSPARNALAGAAPGVQTQAACAYLDDLLEQVRTFRAEFADRWHSPTDPTAPRRYALVRDPDPLAPPGHKYLAVAAAPVLPVADAARHAATCRFDAVTVPDLRDHPWWADLTGTEDLIDLGPATTPVADAVWHQVLDAATTDAGAPTHAGALFAALLTATTTAEVRPC